MTERTSLTGARWTVAPVDEAHVAAMRALGPLREVTLRCMALRGFDPNGGWLTPDVSQLLDPHTMLGMDQAIARLRQAIRDQQRIRVVTDYDVDGTTSSLILQAALARLAPDLKVDYHIPDRFTEGYGFSVAAAQKAADDGVGLIVTADIGVRDHASVSAARARGVDVLVCDHHLPAGESVPAEAIVLCPPQQGDPYGNRSLAACGVSLKLAEALLRDDPRRDVFREGLLKLAAIGTVADLVSIGTLENRAIVALGLAALNHGRHGPGLSALLKVADCKPGEIDEVKLGWQIGPRINAAGRIARATHVVELLNCRDPDRATVLAAELDALNRERRDIQGSLIDTVMSTLREPYDSFVVVAGPEAEGWHRGIVGIVAARVKETVNRPTAVVSIQGEFAVGSVRSVPSVHAVRALDSVADLLLKYGGHPMAAGFTVRAADLDSLRERLSRYVDEHAGESAMTAEHVADAVVRVDELDAGLLAELRRLAPFGSGNTEPKLLVRNVMLSDLRTLGKEQQHLKCTLRRGPAPLELVWWNAAPHAAALREGPVDLLANLRENVWNGNRSLQLQVIDARRATHP